MSAFNQTAAPCCGCNGCWHKNGEGYHAWCPEHSNLKPQATEPAEHWEPTAHIRFRFNDKGEKILEQLWECKSTAKDNQWRPVPLMRREWPVETIG